MKNEKLIKSVFENAKPKWIELAKFMHRSYEGNAKGIWKTQKECQVDFDELPEGNKAVMLMVAECVYEKYIRKEK